MRENRPYGSEGGAARKGRLYPYPGRAELELGERQAANWNESAAEGRWRHRIGVADAAIFPAQGDEKKPRHKPG